MEIVTEQDESATPTQVVEVDRQRLRVAIRRGSSDRPPLLLLNGLGVRLEGLQPIVDALPADVSIIRFDVPGVGESATPRMPYRMWQVARLTSHLLDLLEVPQADVLGVSWGGALAQQFAFQHRKQCRRLILVSTAAGAFLPGRPKVVREMLSRRRFDDKKHARDVAPMIYGGKARSEGQVPPLFNHMRNDPRGLFYQQLAALGWTSLPFARMIRQPTLVLSGDDDPILPPINGKLLNSLIPKARLHIFNDGHLGLVTSADELAPIIEDFLTEY